MEFVTPIEESEFMLKELLGDNAFQLSAYLERDLAALAAPEANEYQEVIERFIPSIIDPLTKATSIQPESEGLNWLAAEQSVLQHQFQTQQFFPNNIVFKPDLDALDPSVIANESKLPPAPVSKAATKKQSLEEEETEEPVKEEKNLKRKLQTRAASKLYRQRKKALEVQLTERLNQLEEEKKLLLQQQATAEKLLESLKEENARLRQQQELTSREVSKTRLDLLKRLALQINANADEASLRVTLDEISKCCRKCVEIGACSLKRLISSNSVERLVSVGFFDDQQKMEILAKGRGNLAALCAKIKEEIKTLSPIQVSTIDRIVLEKSEDFELFYKERAELVQQITTVFRDMKTRRNDMNLMLESVRCLEHLRKSLESEAQMWTEGFHEVMDTLTVLQTAQVLLRIEYQFATVCQLSAFWEALNSAVGNTVPIFAVCDKQSL